MNKKIFKEIELHVVEINVRYYLDSEGLEKMIHDLMLSETGMDSNTLRTIQLLSSSIRKTYKALQMTDEFDVNDEAAVIQLSRKKVKNLVKKAIKLAKKEITLTNGIDELESLAPEEPSMKLSKEESEEVITKAIEASTKPLEDVVMKLEDLFKELKKAPKEPIKQPKKKEKKEKPEEVPDLEPNEIDDELGLSDEELEELAKTTK